MEQKTVSLNAALDAGHPGRRWFLDEMATTKRADAELRELRAYQELRRRRDPTIRRLHRRGVTPGRIAGASGLSVSQVERIVRTEGPAK